VPGSVEAFTGRNVVRHASEGQRPRARDRRYRRIYSPHVRDRAEDAG
jgi:hypothetical protein